MEKLISIITVTYNTSSFLKDYFKSIENTQLFKDGKVEVLIYDGGSVDGTVQQIKDHIKTNDNIKIFEGGNVGFSQGNNYLAKKSSSEYLFILNPDTRLDINCLDNLYGNADLNSIFIPLQQDFKGDFLSCGNGMDIFGFSYWFGSLEKTKKFFYADGAAIFLSRALFLQMGMFNEDFFMFQEDVDLSWRARLMGVLLKQVPGSIVFHYGGGSIEGGSAKEMKLKSNIFRRYNGEKNLLSNLLVNYSFINLIWILIFNFIINLSEIFLFLVLLKPKVSLCYVRSYWWNIKNIKKIIKRREKMQKMRAVSDYEIMKYMYFGSAKFKLLQKVGIPEFN